MLALFTRSVEFAQGGIKPTWSDLKQKEEEMGFKQSQSKRKKKG